PANTAPNLQAGGRRFDAGWLHWQQRLTRHVRLTTEGRREQGARQTWAWKFALLEQEADNLCGARHLGFDREQCVVVDKPLGNADDGVGERVGVDPGVEGASLYLFAVELGELRDSA